MVLISCTQTEPVETETASLKEKVELSPTQKIEKAHSKQDFLSKDVVRFVIVLKFGGTERLIGSMTFSNDVGDAPYDWYIPYSNPESILMEVAAYIVTAGGFTVEEAEEDPHAISYHDYKGVDGIALAHSWKFWEWRKDSGFTRQLGSAQLSNFKFFKAENTDSSAPQGFIIIE